jgi:nucleotide-binding universal stress UspA family protein
MAAWKSIGEQQEGCAVKPALIVCPVEFSAEGRSALAMALALARWYQAEFHVVRGESRLRSQSTRPEGGVAGDAVCARVDDFVAAVNVQGSNVETVALAGDPVAALVDYSRSISAELMVVGQNGRRGSPYWSAGAFSKEVADGVGCPTITVPRDSAPQTRVTRHSVTSSAELRDRNRDCRGNRA